MIKKILFCCLELYLSIFIAKTCFAQNSTVDSLPTNENYWQYNEWYKNNSVVSLIVSGEDKEHLTDSLRKVKLLKNKSVLIGDIIITGGLLFGNLNNNQSKNFISNAKLSSSAIPPSAKEIIKEMVLPSDLENISTELNLSEQSSIDIEPIIDHFEITTSPTWIVRYKGKDYVFEGNFDITRYFSSDGIFNFQTHE